MVRPLHRAAIALASVLALCLLGVGVAAIRDLGSGRDRLRAPPLSFAETAQRAAEVAMYSSHKNRAPDTHYRDAHAKAHGCVRAVFEVLGDEGVPEAYRRGLFRDPGLYLAWVRFSKGDPAIKSDEENDAQGMAIKVMEVPDAGGGRQSQDFLMINNPVFFLSHKEDYLEFVTRRSRGEIFRYFVNGPNPFDWRIRQAWLAFQVLNGETETPLHTEYHSMSAYQLGPDHYAKFRATPCEANWTAEGEIPLADDVPDARPNHLRERMQRYLHEYRACFDLSFLIDADPETTPRDDITVEWPGPDEVPWYALARVTIPDQDFDTAEQNAFCERLSFSPFHTLEEHRPVGEINALREHVYKALFGFRHAQNRFPPYSEPRDWCDSSDWPPTDSNGEASASCRSVTDPVMEMRCHLEIAAPPGGARDAEELPWLLDACDA